MTKRKPVPKASTKKEEAVKQKQNVEMKGQAKTPPFIPFGFMKDLAQPTRQPVNPDFSCTSNAERQIWRQASAVNDFNPDGISLAAIDIEIADAAVRKSIPLLLQSKVVRFVRKAVADANDVPPGTRVDCRSYSLQEADRSAIQEGDDSMAEIARAHPLALIGSPVVQSAIARWIYASWNSADSGVKKTADGLLARARAPKRGRRQQYDYDSVRLRQVYDDLVVYGKMLRKCYKETRSKDELVRWFPDCGSLHEAGMAILDELYIRQYGFPSPSSVASKYLQKRTGMSEAQIFQLISKSAEA